MYPVLVVTQAEEEEFSRIFWEEAPFGRTDEDIQALLDEEGAGEKIRTVMHMPMPQASQHARRVLAGLCRFLTTEAEGSFRSLLEAICTQVMKEAYSRGRLSVLSEVEP